MKTLTDEDLILISGYLTNYSTGDKSYFWAYEEIVEMTSTDPERLWLLMLEMIRRTTDEETLAYIAAGPLEDLLKDHGNEFIERIENLARSDQRFRSALAGVWGLHGEICAHILKACGKHP